MPTFVFTAPDGREYEVDAPQGATEAQAFSVLQGQIGQSNSQDAPASATQTATPQEVMSPALRTAGRLGRNAVAGVASMADVALLAPKTLALGGSMVANAAGFPNAAQKLKQIGQTPSMRDSAVGLIDQATGNKLQPVGVFEKATDFVSEMAVPSAVTGMAANLKPGVLSAARDMLDIPGAIKRSGDAKIINKFGQNRLPADSEKMRAIASETYKRAGEAGGVLKPEATNRFLKSVGDLEPQTMLGRELQNETPFTNVVRKLQIVKDKTLTFQEAQDLDEFLSDSIEDFVVDGKLQKQGKKLLDIQNLLRKTLDDAGPEDFNVGDRTGFDLLKEARGLWRKQAKLRDVEKILARAEGRDNPATIIKNGFSALASNPNRMRGYTAAERAAIKRAAKSGRVGDIARTFGSRLVAIGATVAGGGPAGIAASYAVPALSRSVAEKMAVGRAQNVKDVIANGVAAPPPVSQGRATGANLLSNILARFQ